MSTHPGTSSSNPYILSHISLIIMLQRIGDAEHPCRRLMRFIGMRSDIMPGACSAFTWTVVSLIPYIEFSIRIAYVP
jgi:hypothetical protein